MIGEKNLFFIELKAKQLRDSLISNNSSNTDEMTELEKTKIGLEIDIHVCEFKMEQYMNEWKASAASILGTEEEKREYIQNVLTKYYFEENKAKQFRLNRISVIGKIAEARVLKNIEGREDLNEEYVQVLIREAKLKAECDAMEQSSCNPIDKYLQEKLEYIYFHSKKVGFEKSLNDPRLNGTCLEKQFVLNQSEIAEVEDRIQAYSKELLHSSSIANKKFEVDASKSVCYRAYCEEIKKRYSEDEKRLFELKKDEFYKLIDITVLEVCSDSNRYLNVPKEFLKEYERLDVRCVRLKKQCSLLEKFQNLPTDVYFPAKLEKIRSDASLERLQYIIHAVDESTSELEYKVIESEANIFALKRRKLAYQSEINYAYAYRCAGSERYQFLVQIENLLKQEEQRYPDLVRELEQATIKYNCGDDYSLIQKNVYEGLKEKSITK